MNNPIQPATIKRSSKSQKLVLAVALLVLVGGIWSVFHTQQLRDWYILATYTPPSAVVDIANKDTMTGYGKELLYVNEPQIEGKQAFSNDCPNGAAQSYVIGCYHSGDNGIYLLDVTDPRLPNIVSVTAAYEMLHAGYARLSSADRTRLDNDMWNFYNSHNLGSEIHQQMAAYAKTEPGAKYDELYSVLATEVSDLPSSLESHYKLYFTNRKQIVSMYDGYETAFVSRQNQIKSDDAKLGSLKTEINNNESQLNSLLASIKNEQTTMDNAKASGDISTYNSDVPGYNATVDQYNSLVATTTQEIDTYNNIVSERNGLSFQEQQLVQAINSSPGKPINQK